MTDNEIIKALKECEECHYYNDCEKSTRLALDLINRLQAEIERLKTEKDNLIRTYAECQAEAIKDFAECICIEIPWGEIDISYHTATFIQNTIVKMAKERVEKDD